MKLKCYVLSGIPNSGKSSWAEKQGLPIISCDKIRTEIYGKDYKFSPWKENDVWDRFYHLLRIVSSLEKESFIIDNTNCRYAYISKIKCIVEQYNFDIEVKKFPISLTKAYYRNIKRWILTGKYIPFKVIRNMQKNYKKLWNI